MLHLQELLRNDPNGLDTVKNDLGIKVYYHPDQPLVGFKYSQIDSPKTHKIVKEARGIVLEDGSFDLVGKAFNRFFNFGEVVEEFATFNWNNFYCNEKVDGSIIILFHYNKEWRVNTSGSFGLGEVYFSGKTWYELFWETSGINRQDLNEDITYVFELCTSWNQVVRQYPEPIVFLLSAFIGETEVSPEVADDFAELIGVPRPETYHFHSQDEIKEFLINKEDSDPTFEGVVVRDDKDLRYKAKTSSYLAYAHLCDNGNIANPKRLVPLILAGEGDEICAIFPQFADRVKEVSIDLETHWTSLKALWKQHHCIETQRDFAMTVKHHPFAGILFDLRHKHGINQTEEQLRLEWRSEPDRIVKKLYK